MAVQPPNRSSGAVFRQLAPLATLGVELAAAVLLGGALGWWLDETFHTQPVWTVIGFVFGVATAIVQFIRTVRRLDQQHQRQQSQYSSAAQH